MFERFTTQAREVVVHARAESRRLGHRHVGAEHILLGLIREGDGLAAKIMADAGVDLATLRADVERSLRPAA